MKKLKNCSLEFQTLIHNYYMNDNQGVVGSKVLLVTMFAIILFYPILFFFYYALQSYYNLLIPLIICYVILTIILLIVYVKGRKLFDTDYYILDCIVTDKKVPLTAISSEYYLCEIVTNKGVYKLSESIYNGVGMGRHLFLYQSGKIIANVSGAMEYYS